MSNNGWQALRDGDQAIRLRIRLIGLSAKAEASITAAVDGAPFDLAHDDGENSTDILVIHAGQVAGCAVGAALTLAIYDDERDLAGIVADDVLHADAPLVEWRYRLAQLRQLALVRYGAASVESDRYALMVLGANDGLWHWDLTTGYFYHAPRWSAIMGYEQEEVGHSIEDWLGMVLEEDRLWVDATLEEQVDTPSGAFLIEYRVRCKDGGVRWMLCRGSAVSDTQGGRAKRLAGSQSDITARKEAEHSLKLSEERYALAMQAAKDGLWDWDLATETVYFTPRWKEMLGYLDDQVGNKPDEWFERVLEDDLIWLQAVIEAQIAGQDEPFQIEYRMRHADGNERWMQCSGMTLRDFDGRAIRIVGSQSDITPRKAAEAQVLHDAFHDRVTGLPNRALFLDRVSQALRRPDSRSTVMVLELNRFRSVANNLGLAQSDDILRQIARRLSADIRGTETLARIDTALFGLILDEVEAEEAILKRAEDLHQLLKPALPIEGGISLFITARVGAATGLHGEAPEQILRSASRAMNRGDREGSRSVTIFSDVDRELALNALELEGELRQAIEMGGQLRLFYQPIVDLTSGRLAGFESLMRWIHPVHGLISPAHFIPLAEETGLIVKLGEVALAEACKQANLWQAQNPSKSGLFINVNVSPLQLAEPDYLTRIERILEEYGTPPAALKLEITESTVLGDVDRMIFILSALKDMGLKLAIDDFGTGYSSLSYLHRFKFDAVKIDQSFVRAMRQREDNTLIIRMIAELARGLGCEVIAEGIELQGEVQRLSELGCMYGQGYFFSPPRDPDTASRLIEASFNVGQETVIAD
ncbi:putative bifunctional diguanylate cyclase/phosphodiesterase [Lacibacterium aquatile]|uniref:Bifunctional diguanylate cyclase/phosphodiesterase n=1 Tax=Lacibacterium aquatile TaxID=1168082 RepID=A0ABW5DQB1_9PROT